MNIQRIFTATALCFAVGFTVAFAGGDCCAKKAKASTSVTSTKEVATVASTDGASTEVKTVSTECAGKDAKACTSEQAKSCSTKDAKACSTKAGKSDGSCASQKASTSTGSSATATEVQVVKVVNDAGSNK